MVKAFWVLGVLREVVNDKVAEAEIEADGAVGGEEPIDIGGEIAVEVVDKGVFLEGGLALGENDGRGEEEDKPEDEAERTKS